MTQVGKLLESLDAANAKCLVDEDSLRFLKQIVDNGDEMNQDSSMASNYPEANNNNPSPKASKPHYGNNRFANEKLAGQSVYHCYACNACFGSRSDLYSHMYLHTKEENLECKSCSMHFHRLGDLYEHVSSAHGINQVFYQSPQRTTEKAEKITPRCSICSKVFTTQTYLKIHINGKHTKEIAYKCSFCPKVFYYPSSAKYHIKRCPHKSADVEMWISIIVAHCHFEEENQKCSFNDPFVCRFAQFIYSLFVFT